MQKLYCYVDESGQDTEGKLFIVSAVVAQTERDALIALLERIEQESGKLDRKWTKSSDEQHTAYIQAVFKNQAFQGKLHFATYMNTLEYAECLVETAAEAIIYHVGDDKYKANVFFDGLYDSERDAVAAALRDRGVHTDKVKGLDDRRDILIRLADAICGFLRDALEGRSEFAKMKNKAIREGYLIQVGE